MYNFHFIPFLLICVSVQNAGLIVYKVQVDSFYFFCVIKGSCQCHLLSLAVLPNV